MSRTTTGWITMKVRTDIHVLCFHWTPPAVKRCYYSNGIPSHPLEGLALNFAQMFMVPKLYMNLWLGLCQYGFPSRTTKTSLSLFQSEISQQLSEGLPLNLVITVAPIWHCMYLNNDSIGWHACMLVQAFIFSKGLILMTDDPNFLSKTSIRLRVLITTIMSRQLLNGLSSTLMSPSGWNIITLVFLWLFHH